MSDHSLHAELASVLVDLQRHLSWQLEEGPAQLEAPPRAKADAVAQGQGSLRDRLLASVTGPRPVAEAPNGLTTLPVVHPRVEVKPLDEIRRELGNCTRCKLCQGRKNIVFGAGNPKARLLLVGEGPGAEEDVQGIPFVGAAGQLLTKMIEAMGFSRDDVYICNVVKCRPPNNRNPEPDEIAACEPFLKAQLASVQPAAIVALGKFAAQTLLKTDAPITQLRGVWKKYEGIPMMPTFHPAYLLRQPLEKKKVWADLQQVMKMLGKPA